MQPIKKTIVFINYSLEDLRVLESKMNITDEEGFKISEIQTELHQRKDNELVVTYERQYESWQQ